MFDYDKLLFYKFLGKIEVEESFPKFKITSLCEALGLAEKIGCIDSIASIYEDMGNMFSTRYPVLGISMIRRAENLHLNAGQEHEVLVSKMLRAQACIIYYETCRMHSGKDLSPFKDEAVRIINSIKECSITDKGHLAFFLRLKGLALRHIESLKRALDFYLEAKGYDEAEKTAHSICYVASEINNREELVQGANRYLEITKLIGKKDNIDHVQELVNLLKKWAFVKIDFPTVNLKNNGDRTLLDVLEDFAFKNELWAMDTTQVRQYFPMPQDEGKCFAVSTKSGTVELCPIGARPFVYYRGQSTRYIPSLPTLYRKKLSDAQRYQERLKYMEFRLLIESHPILDKYRGGFSYRFPDGEKQLPFHVNHLGLAQHYGIATELIDITSDMWVAAFFAATSYKGDDKYEVYDDEDGNGVIYVFDQKKSLNKTATPIGIQPFSRPGEQRGYCIKMGEGEDFENIATAIEFKHNKRVNELIFNMANCSLKLFPNDILKRKVDELNKLSSFSVAAKNRVREEFYSHTSDDEINGYCKELNISFSDEPVISFSEADMEDYRENLDKFETHIIDNVKVYPVYNLS